MSGFFTWPTIRFRISLECMPRSYASKERRKEKIIDMLGQFSGKEIMIRLRDGRRADGYFHDVVKDESARYTALLWAREENKDPYQGSCLNERDLYTNTSLCSIQYVTFPGSGDKISLLPFQPPKAPVKSK
jgi:hypothetical protein